MTSQKMLQLAIKGHELPCSKKNTEHKQTGPICRVPAAKTAAHCIDAAVIKKTISQHQLLCVGQLLYKFPSNCAPCC